MPSTRKRKFDYTPYVEFIFGLYMSACAIASVYHFRSAMTAPFLVIFAFGFFYVSLMSFHAQRAPAGAFRPAEQTAKID